MMIARDACAPLRPFVGRIWVGDDVQPASRRELVLPTGFTYVVFRLAGASPGVSGREAGAVVGGARAGSYLREVPGRSWSVGLELLAGGVPWLLGVPANELAEAHTPLDCLWRESDVEHVRDQLASQPTAEAQLQQLECVLLARVPRLRGLHPAVASALTELAHREVGAVVRGSGYSHRGFLDLFSAAVGLTPKRFARVKRFTRALERVHGGDDASLAMLALECGYSDQAHFTRDFRAFAGVTPTAYRAISPRFSHHVPLPEPPSIPFKTATRTLGRVE